MLAETDSGAEPGMFGHQFAGFADKPLAPVGCPREPTEDGERASRRRELASLPPPTEAMRCRSEATKPKRCAVGQTVTMRCRFATNDEALGLAEALAKYKYQPFVEKRHEQLKSVFGVAPVWLKSPRRVAALL